MRLLIDANLSPRVALRLNEAGHDAVHVYEIGLADASDQEILERASADGRIIVSSDSDFSAVLARYGRSEPSFVLLRHANDLGVDEHAELLVVGLPAVEAELLSGAVVTFARGRVRSRRLPFRTT